MTQSLNRSGETHQFWSETPEAIADRLSCSLSGLSADDAVMRRETYGPNGDVSRAVETSWRSVLRRMLEPLSLILLGAGIVSILTGDSIGGAIIVAILVISIGLDTIQEGHAVKAAEVLRKSVALKAEVKRDSSFQEVDVTEVVPGDIVRVRAGDIVPADAIILQSDACTSSEAALTGEPYPVEKRPGIVAASNAADAYNALFRGAVVQTGEATALVVATGAVDAFGRLAPDQKARIVKALQRDGSTVGFMGDGINDAPGLKAADIGLSVEGASGVAQAAADMILLASDLEVVADGVGACRKPFSRSTLLHDRPHFHALLTF